MSLLKCAFCPHKNSRWTDTQGRTGYNRLTDHVREEHPDEYAELIREIRKFNFESGLDDMSELREEL